MKNEPKDYRVRLLNGRGLKRCGAYRALDVEKWRRYFCACRRRWRRLLPSDKAARILEVGCGDGLFVKFLHEMGYESAEGFDRDPAAVAGAREAGINGVFLADLRTYFRQSGRKDHWDEIFALNVIEHLEKDEVLQLLEDVSCALMPGGRLWIRSPNGAGLFGGFTRYVEFTHENAFTTNSLSEILSFAGFEDIRFSSWGPVPHGILSSIRFAGWKFVETALTVLSLLETASAKGGIFTADLLAHARKPADER